MKQFLFAMFLLWISIMDGAAIETSVKKDSPTTKWVSDKGFWVMKSNLHIKNNCTLYFYNNEKRLVYTEFIEGDVINMESMKARKKLKKVLEQVVSDFEKSKTATENKGLVR